MGTKAQTQKDQLLSGLQEVRTGILADAASLPAERQDTVFLGVWSIKDLLAHLAGWDFTNLEAVRDILNGKPPAFYAHYDRDWQTYNAALVAKYKRDSFQKLLSLVQDSHRQLLEFVQGLPAETFNKDFGVRARGYKVTIQRLLEAEFKDELVHSQQITDFFQESSDRA